MTALTRLTKTMTAQAHRPACPIARPACRIAEDSLKMHRPACTLKHFYLGSEVVVGGCKVFTTLDTSARIKQLPTSSLPRPR